MEEKKREKLPIDAKLLSDAVIELNISRRSVGLYPREHPIARESIEKAFEFLRKLFDLRTSITIGIAKDTLVIDEYTLDRKNPDYLGGQFSYLALRSLEYGSFEDLFKSGKTREMSATLGAIEQATDWDHYAFIAAVRRDRKLHSLLSRGCRLLDVGCGTGSLLAKLHSEYPRSNLVGIDPSGKAVAQARKVAKSIKIMKQAGESMKFENEFDIVYLGESLYAAKDKKNVISNCYRALKKGGTIAIVEGLLPESNLQSDNNRLIMGMQLDFALQGHMFMKRREVAELLGRFSRVRFEELWGSVYLVTGMK